MIEMLHLIKFEVLQVIAEDYPSHLQNFYQMIGCKYDEANIMFIACPSFLCFLREQIS